MGYLLRAVDEIEADGAGPGALGPHAMADRLLGIFRQQALELGLGPLVLQIGLSGVAEDARLLFRVGLKLANEKTFPAWKAGSEFSRE
jgi:hypothetical protein